MSGQLSLQLQLGALREELVNARIRCELSGNRVRVKCVSECSNPDWYCAFPKRLRSAGLEFVVYRLIAMRRHYRAIPPYVELQKAPIALVESGRS
jgi:hypothetical protein